MDSARQPPSPLALLSLSLEGKKERREPEREQRKHYELKGKENAVEKTYISLIFSSDLVILVPPPSSPFFSLRVRSFLSIIPSFPVSLISLLFFFFVLVVSLFYLLLPQATVSSKTIARSSILR